MNFLKRQVHGSEDPDELGPLPWVKVNTQQLPNHLPPPQCFGPHPFYRLPPKHLRTASSLSTYNLSGLLNLARGLTQLAWDSAPQRSFERTGHSARAAGGGGLWTDASPLGMVGDHPLGSVQFSRSGVSDSL